ncbi:GNAT family N-acetyltransferase [Afifella sp. IM 167]|uniref:GNAT family N-acetyltransferase n=1 Tax=Afifella sp. IM 167 TaxID=2033586 RepID=UPI001CCBDA10|nr:GNAT family N-acetyltransferase [Afifella sp. IM 167]MBZ8133387.1 GNAT family N-acetyltransferase [Afifella sp. IM 167]
MRIRKAEPGDAEAMSSVLTASIAELCVPDHGGLPANIERWTSNKTPENVRAWIADPASRVLVVEDGGEIVCVGSFAGPEVLLNYVKPSARFRGASKALLAHMEQEMRDQGVAEARLTSTATAHRFYRASGWTDAGEPGKMFGIAKAHPMRKQLS